MLRTKQETRDRLLSITQNYESDGAQSSKDPHKYDRLVEIESLIDGKVEELVMVKAEILAAILKLNDSRERTVLKCRYVDMKTWEQTAVEMNYSYMQVTRLHGYALAHIKDVIECYIHPVV